MKQLKDLPEDIYALFNPDEDHVPSEEHLDAFCENLKALLRSRLAKQEQRGSPLRISALGKPNRQMWFEAHPVEGGKEALTPKTYLKFMYGDVIEQLFLFLGKEAGHTIEQEQAEIEVDGVLGHIDAIIDGVVVDVKSASSYGFAKFKTDTVTDDDPFGYVQQLSGYSNVLTPGKDAAWFAIDKVSGELCISVLPNTIIKHYPPEPRIKELKSVIESDVIPDLCYEPVADGKSGNFKLPTPCSYCAHKFRCHPGLRTFIYSSGPRYLTTVVREPDVHEVSQ